MTYVDNRLIHERIDSFHAEARNDHLIRSGRHSRRNRLSQIISSLLHSHSTVSSNQITADCR
jgi:hypothetical protein